MEPTARQRLVEMAKSKNSDDWHRTNARAQQVPKVPADATKRTEEQKQVAADAMKTVGDVVAARKAAAKEDAKEGAASQQKLGKIFKNAFEASKDHDAVLKAATPEDADQAKHFHKWATSRSGSYDGKSPLRRAMTNSHSDHTQGMADKLAAHYNSRLETTPTSYGHGGRQDDDVAIGSTHHTAVSLINAVHAPLNSSADAIHRHIRLHKNAIEDRDKEAAKHHLDQIEDHVRHLRRHGPAADAHVQEVIKQSTLANRDKLAKQLARPKPGWGSKVRQAVAGKHTLASRVHAGDREAQRVVQQAGKIDNPGYASQVHHYHQDDAILRGEDHLINHGVLKTAPKKRGLGARLFGMKKEEVEVNEHLETVKRVLAEYRGTNLPGSFGGIRRRKKLYKITKPKKDLVDHPPKRKEVQ